MQFSNPSEKDKACFGSKYSMFWVEISYVLGQDIVCFEAKHPMFLSEIMHKNYQHVAYCLIYNTLPKPVRF